MSNSSSTNRALGSVGIAPREVAVSWRAQPRASHPWRALQWRSLPWRTIAATVLLGAVVIGWAAVPMSSGSGGALAALVVAIAAGVLSIAQLLVAGIGSGDGLGTLAEQLADGLLGFLNWLPWAELMIIAAVALEALHPAPPWHTAVLGVALLGYLFALHLAETGASPRVLRPQLGLLAAGIGLMALAVGAAALPALQSGLASSVIRVAAIVAAVVAGALTFPVWLGRRR